MGRYFLLYGKGNGNARTAFGGAGAKGSKGSKGFKRVQRVVVSLFRAMSIKSALRDSLLCHQRCITKSRSPLPKEGGGAVGDGG